MFLGNWRPVFEHMDELARTYAHEVLDVRNCVAHWSKDEDFPIDDAKRALDTMRRLLKFIGKGPAADESGGLEERPHGGFGNRSHEERIINSLSKDTHSAMIACQSTLGSHQDKRSIRDAGP